MKDRRGQTEETGFGLSTHLITTWFFMDERGDECPLFL
jgi:hypothetical protein